MQWDEAFSRSWDIAVCCLAWLRIDQSCRALHVVWPTPSFWDWVRLSFLRINFVPLETLEINRFAGICGERSFWVIPFISTASLSFIGPHSQHSSKTATTRNRSILGTFRWQADALSLSYLLTWYQRSPESFVVYASHFVSTCLILTTLSHRNCKMNTLVVSNSFYAIVM